MPDMSLTQAVETPQVRKAPAYEIKSSRAPVAGGGEVGRGVNVKSGQPFVIFTIGLSQQALPLQAVAAAIYHGVITRAEIAELHAKADDAAKVAAKAGAR